MPTTAGPKRSTTSVQFGAVVGGITAEPVDDGGSTASAGRVWGAVAGAAAVCIGGAEGAAAAPASACASCCGDSRLAACSSLNQSVGFSDQPYAVPVLIRPAAASAATRSLGFIVRCLSLRLRACARCRAAGTSALDRA